MAKLSIMMYRPTTRLDKISYEAGNQSDRQGGRIPDPRVDMFQAPAPRGPREARAAPEAAQEGASVAQARPQNRPETTQRPELLIKYLREIQERPSSFAKYFTCLAGDRCDTPMSQL